MNIEVGMYVRTIYGIAKIIEFSEAISKRGFWLDANINTDNIEGYENYCTVHDVVGDPSFDIIDLIEPGDYVNGHRVCEICKDKYYGRCVKLEIVGIYVEYHEEINPSDVKSIVTKEQFAEMEYKVGK